ncbi:caspase family protein [Xylanibacter muris]|uniref:Caspase family protein n=1 Tax=Xylanibacter muris TaxID=2736290 RepID=A0ABX2AQ25_9BACT|nr:caspase family protein [Xylanibacter muris]NPD92835.1 caspase family protein [Xylanibacter muris]
MEEQGREKDRTAELKQMTEFCSSIADALDFSHDLRCHSGSEFTSTMLEKEISSLNVQEGDIVLFYYAGHGCNWDDDDWPHMTLLDRQYWETTVFSKLKNVSGKAKLLLCISSCCNMDSEGRRRERQQYSTLDKEKTKKLFLGFEGKKAIVASSSIRGQYTYSWSSGPMLGSIYTISLRKTINEALNGTTNTELTWDAIFESTKNQTLVYTNGKQLPQYKIEINKPRNITITQVSTSKAQTANASIEEIWIEHNKMHNDVKCMEIHAKLITHYMDDKGGRLVALFESPKGTALKDMNNNYRTVDGQVSVGTDFGSHYEHAKYSNIIMIIPNSEIHAVKGQKDYFIRLGIYDYHQKKYIQFSDYIRFSL